MNKLQLTFAMLKPNILRNPIAFQQIHDIILANNFHIVQSKHVLFKNELAEKFYGEHKNKFFYNRLTTFMARYIYDMTAETIKYMLYSSLVVIQKLSSWLEKMLSVHGEVCWGPPKYSMLFILTPNR